MVIVPPGYTAMANGLNQGCGFFWLSPVAGLWRRLVFTMVAAVPPRFLPPQSWMFMIYSANLTVPP